MNTIAFDCEVFPNYFLLMFGNSDGFTHYFEIKQSEAKFTAKQISEIKELFRNHEIVGFNSKNFDLPIVLSALRGATAGELFDMCSDIIGNNLNWWQTYRKYAVNVPGSRNHIDLINLLRGKASLKLYGARIHFPELQDLPIENGTSLDEKQMSEIRDYCSKDISVTFTIFERLADQINLRRELSKRYGTDLRSSGDASIAETVLKLEKTKHDDEPPRKDTHRKTFKYSVPEYLKTSELSEIPELKKLMSDLEEVDFGVDNGRIVGGDHIFKWSFDISGTRYQFGMGGLHSIDEAIMEQSDHEFQIFDCDVSSYYPSLIINEKISPSGYGGSFLTIYRTMTADRIKAKKLGDKTRADCLKIVLNSAYGKLNDRYSALYDPEKMLQVTFTGQLSLLLLVVKFEKFSFRVISANTDGVTAKVRRSDFQKYRMVMKEWELETNLSLEICEYTHYFARDVNNYFARKNDGSLKRKGLFAQSSFDKNPHADIVAESVIAFLLDGTPFMKTLHNELDIRKFIKVRTVRGGALYKGVYLGKVVRFIYSNNQTEAIYTKKTTVTGKNSLVAESEDCFPIMNISKEHGAGWYDLDYERYEQECVNLYLTINRTSKEFYL